MKNNNLIKQYCIRLGDDALIMGHRLSEWCRNGPFLEEDIALSNIALDYIGRARMFYGYAAELSDNTLTEDDLAFMRDTREYENNLIYELPRGDFAYTIIKQLIVDIYNYLFLEELKKSTDEQLSAIANKAIKETNYHLRRSIDWAMRLGDGTEESHQRIQTALDMLWGYIPELFETDDVEKKLSKAGIAVDVSKLEGEFRKILEKTITDSTLKIPDSEWKVSGGRKGIHTEHLGHLLSEMQYMQRSFPGLEW